MFLCGFGRRWFGFVPFGTERLTEGVSYLLQQQCGYFSDVGGVDYLEYMSERFST